MSGFVDLELDDEDQLDAVMPLGGDKPTYPFGLRICLCEAELKKLGFEPEENPDHGDYLMLKIMARVTSCTISDGPDGGPCRRVELQIEKAKVVEDDGGDEGVD